MRTKPCSTSITQGRLDKAHQFIIAAETIRDIADQGDSHEEAATLLASADKDAAMHLRTLLRLKTKAGYGHTPATIDEVKKANRAADALVEKARRVRGPAHAR